MIVLIHENHDKMVKCYTSPTFSSGSSFLAVYNNRKMPWTQIFVVIFHCQNVNLLFNSQNFIDWANLAPNIVLP